MADDQDLERLRMGEKDLTHCDFRDADLSDLDLQDRDFSSALLHNAKLNRSNLAGSTFDHSGMMGTNFEGADCQKVRFKLVLHGVNFANADLREAVFTSHLTSCCFDGADVRGAVFRGTTINDGTTFDGTVYDAETDFEGATALRPLTRLPVFEHFVFEKGRLLRRQEIETPSSDKPEASQKEAERQTPTVSSSLDEQADAAVLPRRLSERPAEIRVLAEGLAHHIVTEIAILNGSKPNDPDALDVYDRYVEFLAVVQAELSLISDAVAALEATAPHKRLAKTQPVAEMVRSLQGSIGDWLNQNASRSANYGLNVGLLGLGAAFLSFCGVPPALSFPALAVMLGSKAIAATAKGIAGRSKS